MKEQSNTLGETQLVHCPTRPVNYRVGPFVWVPMRYTNEIPEIQLLRDGGKPFALNNFQQSRIGARRPVSVQSTGESRSTIHKVARLFVRFCQPLHQP
jgi:hypothetical protein